MASYCKVSIIGNLGKDPEIRYTSDGTAVATFSIATTERKKDKSGNSQDVTTWFRITLWRRLAEIANEYLKKGSQVFVEGKLSQSEYQDKDGNTRTSLEVNASEIQLIGSRGEEAKGAAASSGGGSSSSVATDDDIPF
jgi:single-strand DNA-binding protein